MKNFLKHYLFYFLITIFILVLVAGFIIDRRFFNRKSNPGSIANTNFQYQSPSLKTAPEDTSSNNQPTTIAENQEQLPESYLIENVPFQSQAPFANWDQLHDEACEEASIILVKYFLENQSLAAETMDAEILKMVDWQIKNWGKHKDLTVKETAELAENFYNLEARTQNNIDIDDIKKEIIQNHPVIVPTAGRLLGNPNFRQPGPIYHMLVVIGFDGHRIITQDVGTRKGDHYEYNEKIFFNAIHDWNGSSDNIENGAKAMIILSN